METVFITFRSITAAQRGEWILKEAHMKPVMLRTPRWMQERGCGYSLKLGSAFSEAAVEALRQKGAQFVKVYVQGRDGQLREMSL